MDNVNIMKVYASATQESHPDNQTITKLIKLLSDTVSRMNIAIGQSTDVKNLTRFNEFLNTPHNVTHPTFNPNNLEYPW